MAWQLPRLSGDRRTLLCKMSARPAGDESAENRMAGLGSHWKRPSRLAARLIPTTYIVGLDGGRTHRRRQGLL